ncbi:unnamed protein product, partial [Didymodactylos carnosus]
CFDGDTTVVREDGSRVRMRNLKVGDQVIVAYKTSDNGIELRSSPILAMDIYQKYDNDSPVDYLEIQVAANISIPPLHITRRHSLLVRREHDSEVKYLFASQVNIGDHLYLLKNDYRSAVQTKITHIKDVTLFDAYAPLTLEGNLVVNDVVVSCYGTFTHSFVHLAMAPRRWLLYGALHTTLMGQKYVEEHFNLIIKYLMAINLL